MRIVSLFIFFILSNYGFAQTWEDSTFIDTVLNFKESNLELKTIDYEYFEAYYLSDSILDTLIDKFGNSFENARKIEQYQISKWDDNVIRAGEYISFKLMNGGVKILNLDSISSEGSFSFEYFFEMLGYYSVVVQLTEGNQWKLINSNNGKEVNIPGRPFFSKSGEFLLSVGNDFEANFSFNGFVLYQLKKGNFMEIGRYTPESWGCAGAKWISDTELVIMGETINYKNENGYFNFYMLLSLD